jgi:hypothetical protein
MVSVVRDARGSRDGGEVLAGLQHPARDTQRCAAKLFR